jgi:hypothetical protein
MQSTTYKLAEYKITENEHGDLWWETHIGLGSLRIGKCFINGDILFINGEKLNTTAQATKFINVNPSVENLFLNQ